MNMSDLYDLLIIKGEFTYYRLQNNVEKTIFHIVLN